jgi:acyl carrier protein
MVPSFFVELESLPLTPNGKVDRNKLPHPDRQQQSEKGFVQPRTDAEKTIASIWCEILKTENISIYDNFFDLGGHSLLATRVVSRLRKNFMINLPISSMFEYPTIESLAGFIETFQWVRDVDEIQVPRSTYGRESGEL